MGKLTRRLEKLEQRVGPRRCHQCRDWPDTRVIWSDPAMVDLTADWAQQWGTPARPTPPERCVGCGWEPLTITVEYVEELGRPIGGDAA